MSSKMAKSDAESISLFFAGRSILVTGGTGFMGKALIEKLLRSCPEIREIFLLIRPLNGITVEERLRQLLQNPLFDDLRESNPSIFEKLIPIIGNTCHPELGILPESRQLIIERVSVILNLAGNVRFDNKLKDHILTNTVSTNGLCILAENIKNLVAFVHVSTAYSQCDKQTIEEIEYPADTDWKKTVKVAESIDEKTLMIFGEKYCGIMPNTYTFSKKLAENVLSDYKKRLPIVLIRPSVVSTMAREPLPGWVDGFQGIAGVTAGWKKGLLRVILADDKTTLDVMPVDVAIGIIVAAALKRGLEPLHANPELRVYNCSAAIVRSLSLKEYFEQMRICNEQQPMGYSLWYSDLKIVSNSFIYSILSVLLHLVPATLIDLLLKLSGHKPVLSKVQIMVQGIINSSKYFGLHNWYIRNEKAMNLLAEGIKRDEGCESVLTNMSIPEYLRNMLYGASKFLLREDVTKLKEARIHLTRLWWLDRIFKACLLCLFTWILHRWGLFDYTYNNLVL